MVSIIKKIANKIKSDKRRTKIKIESNIIVIVNF